MVQQYFTQQVPSVRLYDEEKNLSTSIDHIDVLEVTPETNSRIAKHPGESGKVYADTRVIMPARYRAKIVVPEGNINLSDGVKNLLDASFSQAQKYALTSLFSRCYNMMVVSSRCRDTTDMTNLRIQDVVFEECLIMGDTRSVPDDQEDAAFVVLSPQFVKKDEKSGK